MFPTRYTTCRTCKKPLTRAQAQDHWCRGTRRDLVLENQERRGPKGFLAKLVERFK